MKYIAIKLKGLNHWIWFKAEKVKEEAGQFKGHEGWGKDGALTSIDVSNENIEGRILCDELQYS